MEFLRERLIEKIESEYELFYLDVTKFSKANIFAKSFEIECKKEITKYLKSSSEIWNENELKKLFLYPNLLEETYRFVSDHNELPLGESMHLFVKGNFRNGKNIR